MTLGKDMFTEVRVAKQLLTYLHENVDRKCVVVMASTLTVKVPPEKRDEVPSTYMGYPLLVTDLEPPAPRDEHGALLPVLTEEDFISFECESRPLGQPPIPKG